MSTLQTLAGEPLTWDELTANVDAWYALHGPDGLIGWPPPSVPVISSRCRRESHSACHGLAVGPSGYADCGCSCHP